MSPESPQVNARTLNSHPSGTDTIGLIGAIALLVILAVAYFAGGYVAGQMARFDGARQGFAVWLIGLVIVIVLAVAGTPFGAKYNVLVRLDLPRIPVDEGTATHGAILALVAILVMSAAAAVLGRKAGERYHRRIDRTAITVWPGELAGREPNAGVRTYRWQGIPEPDGGTTVNAGHEAQARPEPLLGLSEFTDVVAIASGATSQVFRARQPSMDRLVAIKVLAWSAHDSAVRARFERELAVLGRLSRHPLLITIHTHGITEAGHPYLVMPWYERGSVADELRRRVR